MYIFLGETRGHIFQGDIYTHMFVYTDSFTYCNNLTSIVNGRLEELFKHVLLDQLCLQVSLFLPHLLGHVILSNSIHSVWIFFSFFVLFRAFCS